MFNPSIVYPCYNHRELSDRHEFKGDLKMNFKSVSLMAAGVAMAATTILGTGIPAFAQVKHVAKKAATPQLIVTQMETGKMVHKKGWPKFTVSQFHTTAGKVVKLVIKSYDDGSAPVPVSYTKVRGTIGGSELVNGKKVTTFKAADVAHTMTIMEGGKTINIVVPVRTAKEKFVTVTAEFSFAKPGNYMWQCYAACGTGSSGWMGPMMTSGWMKGAWHVAK